MRLRLAPVGGPTRRRLQALAAVVLGACVLASCSGATASTGAPSLKIPLDTTLLTSEGTWVVVPLGQPGSLSNTFWQLFFQPAGKSKWVLVTPPGVGDNGGLTIAGARAQLTAGVIPSLLLKFSPLAQTSDGGGSWAQGTLPAGLEALPDAVAVASGTGATALVSTHGGELETSANGLSNWTLMATRQDLRATAGGQACGIDSLTAITVMNGSSFAVGTSCTHPGVVGIFAAPAGGGALWQLVGPRLRGAAARATTQVVCVQPPLRGNGLHAGELGAVVALHQGGTTSFISILGPSPQGLWQVSAPLTLPAGSSVAATGTGGGGQVFLVLRGPSGESSAAVSSPGGRWQVTKGLPIDTATVVVSARGELSAVTTGLSDFEVWSRRGANHWVVSQTLTVPVPLGSSG
jgi:hypothetical protein